ncbi:MAG: hypothetical protein ACE5NM_07390, partial [Sedimentisphaerales bacterium]
MISCKGWLGLSLVVPTAIVIFGFCLSQVTQQVLGKDITPGEEDKAETVSREGLASRYKADQGIENDPEVIFAENFEEDSLHAVTAHWESLKNIEIMSLSTDVPSVSAGKHSLLMTHIGGKGNGG